MADSSDVELALVDAVIAASGNATIVAHRGLPPGPLLDASLAAGRSHVAIVATDKVTNVTRYLQSTAIVTPVAPSLTASVAGKIVTFGGVGGAGQVVGVSANGLAWAYRLTGGDTPETCAAVIGALVSGAVVSGRMVTVEGLEGVRIVADQPVSQEVMRQTRRYDLAMLCPSAAQRDALASEIMPFLADMVFLMLADGTRARMQIVGEAVSDQAEPARLWRRDLTVEVEYPVVLRTTLPEMLFGTMTAQLDGAVTETVGDAPAGDAGF